MVKPTLIQAQSAADIAAVKSLFLEYLQFVQDYLGQDLAFQGTDVEFATFPDIYDALFLAKLNGQPAGAAAVKPFKGKICELKRLYCRPNARGLGLGQALTEHCISAARDLGYTKMYLDTDPGLIHANSIYERLGFTDIVRYYDNPLGDSRYMELDL